MKIEPLLVTPAEAGRMIGFKETKIFDMLRSGELTRIKIGRETRIEVAEIKAWIEKQKMKQAS